MLTYKKDLLEKLENEGGDKRFWKRAYKYHLAQLQIFNTERLIHLMVMLFVGLYMVIFFCFALTANNQLLMFLGLVTLVLFVAYVVYYFKLENTVQFLSRYSTVLEERIEESGESKLASFRFPPVVDMIIDKASEFLADFLARKR